MVDDGLDDVASYLNHHHRDTLTLIARTIAGAGDFDAASLLSVDGNGCVLATRPRGGSSADAPRYHRVEFEQTATTIDGVRSAFFAVVRRARRLDAGATPLTSLEVVVADAERDERRTARVHAVRDLVAGIRQITLSVRPPIATLGGDEYVRVNPPLTPGGAFYTVRRTRPEVGEIDIWVVLHRRGVTSRWAAEATAGEEVILGRPRRSFRPPADTTQIVLLGDETGLAAIARILDEMTADVPIVVVTDVDADAATLVQIATRVPLVHRCVQRHSASDPTRLWLRHVEHTATTYYFGAGEESEMAAVKRYLQRELDVDRAHLMVTGYWRRD